MASVNFQNPPVCRYKLFAPRIVYIIAISIVSGTRGARQPGVGACVGRREFVLARQFR